ncbi:toast rack family protein [Lysinibacillus sp. FSL K6-0232]|uniref:toast rack family protein n=1 Tax=Lysinibacillus sp. FSL K6-0232 TaxID=2921425 RepID=UPI0030F7B79E
MKKVAGLAAVMGTSALLLAGCFSFIPSKMQEEAIVVEKDQAKALAVDIDFGIGEMSLTGGAEEWVEGSASYNMERLAPQVSYNVRKDKGEIVIEHKNGSKPKLSKVKNSWTMQLNNDVPMDLTVETGASKAHLDLQGLQLENLEIETGVGDVTVDLGGDWHNSFTTTLETGVGQTTVILPSAVGVKLTLEKGIGSSTIEGFTAQGDGVYVNEAYESADVVVEVNAEMGIGEITFTVDQ